MDMENSMMIVHIDTTTEEGKNAMAELLVDAVLNEPQEQLEKPYTIRWEAYHNYEDALAYLAFLKGKGILDFTYSSLYHPYREHYIEVTWKEKNSVVEMETKQIIMILKKLEYIVFDSVSPLMWQLSSKIYVPA